MCCTERPDATDEVVGHGPVKGLDEVGRGEVPNLVTGADGGVAQGELGVARDTKA